MKKAHDIIKLVSAVTGAIVITVSLAGQYRRHSAHDAHSQSCACLSGCGSCAWEAARGR